MFGKRKKEQKVIARTKEELKAAVKRKEPLIEVQGDLANKMKWMGKLSKKKIVALIAVLSAVAVNPLAAGGAAAVQGVLGISEGGTAILLIGAIGGTVVLAILKGYNVEIETEPLPLKIKLIKTV